MRFFGEDRVADRPAVRLAVMPRDEDRFGYRLWLDKESRLLLKSELIDAEGNALEIFQFSSIVIGDQVDPAALQPSAEHEQAKVSNFTLDSQPSVPVSGSSPLAGRLAAGGFHPVQRACASDHG